MEKNKQIPVILNTGIGTDIDDTWALAAILRSPEISLKCVLTTGGDTYYRAKIVGKILEIAGRSDVDIAIGNSEPCSGMYQESWIAGYSLNSYPGIVHTQGIKAVSNYLKQVKETITIINLCDASSIHEILTNDFAIASGLRFLGMYGSLYRGYEDNSEPCIESNIKSNVKAFKQIMTAPWQEFIIAPLDTSSLVILDGLDYKAIYNSPDPLLRAVIENYRIWAGLVPWEKIDYYKERSSRLFDMVPVYLAYASDFINIEKMNLLITDEGKTISDPDGLEVSVAISWKNLEVFKKNLTEKLLQV